MKHIYLLTTSDGEEYAFTSIKKSYNFCAEKLSWYITDEEIGVIKAGGFISTGGWKVNNPTQLRRISLN